MLIPQTNPPVLILRGHVFRQLFVVATIGAIFFLTAVEARAITPLPVGDIAHPDSIGIRAPEPTASAGDRPAAEVLSGLSNGVQKIVLENGLKVLIYKRGFAPVFSGQVWVKVGGVNEQMGKTGAAHMLEHMAFKGTTQIGTTDFEKEKGLLAELETEMHKAQAGSDSIDPDKVKQLYQQLSALWVPNEFSRIYQRRGAVGLNAATSKDYTMYMVQLPTVDFELWCWMESERLLNPVFREFYKEREVVMEERRMRTDDSPDGRMYEAMLAAAFWAHPNRFPVIGWANDIRSLTATDSKQLHNTYYRADNMVIALVGDLDAEKIRPMLEAYFGRLPKGVGEIPKITTIEEPQKGERVAEVQYDATPSIAMAYHKPIYPNKDDIYFSLLHSLLGDGRSSLFYRELVIDRQLAVAVDTSEAPGNLFPSLFYVMGIPRDGVSNDRLRDEVQKILDRLKSQLVSEKDFEAARKRVRTSFLGELDSNNEIAETLAHSELIYGDWRAILKMYDDLSGMTREDIKRIVETYLTIPNRTYVHLERTGANESATKQGSSQGVRK